MKGIIFGATLESTYDRFDKLIKDYQMFWDIEPFKYIHTMHQNSVVFDNGDIWNAYKIGENCRGRKANIVLIDRDISPEERIIAECCAISVPYGAVQYY